MEAVKNINLKSRVGAARAHVSNNCDSALDFRVTLVTTCIDKRQLCEGDGVSLLKGGGSLYSFSFLIAFYHRTDNWTDHRSPPPGSGFTSPNSQWLNDNAHALELPTRHCTLGAMPRMKPANEPKACRRPLSPTHLAQARSHKGTS